ncbi:MAG: hypothetical protein RRZ91_05380 [Cetobacterium sp.]|uniref:hypothetical protein n=1 Tax=Cetobacterium sp. TaxID=2071632 RepID=UPI002FC87328
MKNLILVFLFLFSILKADYLITNGEIALFYDGKNNVLKNVRGKIYHKDKIANLQILLIKDYKIYQVRDYYTQVEFKEGKNIFKMTYTIDGQNISTYVILSNEDRNNMYIYTDLKDVNWNTDYRIVYKISPMLLTGNILNNENYFEYDDMNISTGLNTQIFVATETNLEKFKVKVLESSLVKELDERIYVVKNIEKNSKSDGLLTINFNNENLNKLNLSFEDIYSKEIKFWNNFDKKYFYLRKSMVNQIKNFYIINSNSFAQSSLNMNTSRANYLTELKVRYLNAILNRDEKILSKFSFEREKGIQNIYSYYYYIKISNLFNINLSNNEKAKRLIPSIKENINKAYQEILDKEGDWLSNSFIFCEVLEELKLIFGTNLNLENVELMKKDVKNRLEKEILNSKGIIKNNSYIKYLKLLPPDKIKNNLNVLLKQVNNSYGILMEDDSIQYVENLELALFLYEQGLTEESDKIFYALDYFMRSSEKQNEIYTEEVFLYIKNIYYRGLL